MRLGITCVWSEDQNALLDDVVLPCCVRNSSPTTWSQQSLADLGSRSVYQKAADKGSYFSVPDCHTLGRMIALRTSHRQTTSYDPHMAHLSTTSDRSFVNSLTLSDDGQLVYVYSQGSWSCSITSRAWIAKSPIFAMETAFARPHQSKSCLARYNLGRIALRGWLAKRIGLCSS